MGIIRGLLIVAVLAGIVFAINSFTGYPGKLLEKSANSANEDIKTVLAEIDGKVQSIPEGSLPTGYKLSNDSVYRPATAESDELKALKAELDALKANGNKPAASSEIAKAISLPALQVVDGKTVSDWRDPSGENLAEKITLGTTMLTMQGSASDRKGAIAWESLKGADSSAQAAFQAAKEEDFSTFLLNRIPSWTISVLKYEDEDGKQIALLIKVSDLDYRLWRITSSTRSIPTSKDDLEPIQYGSQVRQPQVQQPQETSETKVQQPRVRGGGLVKP